MYSFHSRIRYSELDLKGVLSLEQIINYFQDASTFHSEHIGRGPSTYTRDNVAWVLSSWQVVVDRYPTLGESIEICTAPYSFKGFSGNRNFWMVDNDGKRIVSANSIWTLINLNTGLPTRITPFLVEGYQVEEKISMVYEQRKIALPEEKGFKTESITIRKHHIDTNNHVNNGRYIAMAMDSVEEDFHIRQMRVEYKKSAKLGDEIIPYRNKRADRHVIQLCDEEQQLYAVVELLLF